MISVLVTGGAGYIGTIPPNLGVKEIIFSSTCATYGVPEIMPVSDNADAEGEIGEDHEPETHLIPRAIQAALGEIPEIDIYGSDYATADGTAVRDYIHVGLGGCARPCAAVLVIRLRERGS